MKIGITFLAMKNETSTIWSNGATQNIFFLYQLFKVSTAVHQLYLINLGDADAIPEGFAQGQSIELSKFDEVADQLDVLIEGGVQITPEQASRVHLRGGIVISYRCGNDYIIDTERILFDINAGVKFNGAHFDEIWTHGQHINTCKHYWTVALNAPVQQMPHIWMPYFVDRLAAEIKALPEEWHFGYEINLTKRQNYFANLPQSRYTPHADVLRKRVSNFEPNVNVVKTSITPMLACEIAHRQRPELFDQFFFCGTDRILKNPHFDAFTKRLTAVQNGLVQFEARYALPFFLAKNTDIVVCHQWENALNYVYYDAIHGHYPIVHNSPFLRDIGYFYEEFDAQAAANALVRAATEHDTPDHLQQYGQQCDAFIQARSIHHSRNADAHISRLHHLLQEKRKLFERTSIDF